MREITVAQGLNELKLYKNKIGKAIPNAVFIGAAKKSSKKIGNISKDIFRERAESSYQSVNAMIKNYRNLKSAIVCSNAETEIMVNGKKMTRAEAIERKNSIVYDELLLEQMKSQYNSVSNKVTKENIAVDNKIDSLLTTMVGRDSDKKIDKDSMKAIMEPYRIENEWDLVDPLSILKRIEELEADIEGFKSSVDIALSVSNATTVIKVDF